MNQKTTHISHSVLSSRSVLSFFFFFTGEFTILLFFYCALYLGRDKNRFATKFLLWAGVKLCVQVISLLLQLYRKLNKHMCNFFSFNEGWLGETIFQSSSNEKLSSWETDCTVHRSSAQRSDRYLGCVVLCVNNGIPDSFLRCESVAYILEECSRWNQRSCAKFESKLCVCVCLPCSYVLLCLG